jgi:hypothetical protein
VFSFAALPSISWVFLAGTVTVAALVYVFPRGDIYFINTSSPTGRTLVFTFATLAPICWILLSGPPTMATFYEPELAFSF